MRGPHIALCIWLVATSWPGSCAFADACDIEPFLLGDDVLLPMPGMRDAELVFESEGICRALPVLLPERIRQRTFWLHEVRGEAPQVIVALGGGLVAPRPLMGCQYRVERSTLLFENGRIYLSPADSPDNVWRLEMATSANAARSLVRQMMPEQCWPTYLQAVGRALALDSANAATLVSDAAYLPEHCEGDDFRSALRGLLNRAVHLRLPGLFTWAPLGRCFLSGRQHLDDSVGFELSCPGEPDEVVIVLRPHAVGAFVGANQGMTADAIIHPMDETCLSAWDTWRAQGAR